MKTIDFSTGVRVKDFVLSLREAFPLFRNFLDDEDDALIHYFLQTQQTSLKDLVEMREALGHVLGRIAQYYPSMMPPSPSVDNRYPLERCMVAVVANLANATMHLQSTVSSFVTHIEQGGDITTLC